MDLEDLEVDLEEDLEQFSNYYSNYYKLVAAQGIKTAPSRLELGFLKALFHNKALEVKQNYSRPSLVLGKVHPVIDQSSKNRYTVTILAQKPGLGSVTEAY